MVKNCGLEGESAERREIVLGEYETRLVPAECLVMLSQVRGGVNPESDKLKRSIDTNGMINPIDIAVMSEENLATYISFVNKVWSSNLSVDQYRNRQLEDDNYALVVAGHSRTGVVLVLAREQPENRYIINCKVHPISSPEDIINLQLEENIHAQPSQERQAMAIIEAYMWGVETGRWTSREEFLRHQGGAIKPTQLENALGFSRLPDGIRQFVLAKHIPYTAALEIGKHTQTLIAYEKKMMGIERDGSDEEMEMLEKAVSYRITEMVMIMNKKKLNSTAAKKYIEGELAAWRKTLHDNGATDDPAFELDLFSAAHQADDYVRERARSLEHHLQELGSLPVSQIQSLMEGAALLSGIDTAKARRELQRNADKAYGLLGRSALGQPSMLSD